MSSSPNREPIAIVGTGLRFPGGANDASSLWELLREPRDLLTTIPESRFDPTSFYHPDGLHHGTSNVKHSYLLSEDHRRFDAQFFGIKPVEANSIDPQQRLLLETVYESIESAGLSIAGLQGSNTAVYVGLMSGDYADLLNRDSNAFPTYFATGTARSILSNRVSYFFDWHGPSMTIDTACSSSIVALHQAVQALRAGDCKVAIAAGTNLILGPEQYIAESKLKMLSPNGRSRMWDRDADGYARGDGVASVVLKTLSEALAANDVIECVIRETGINQDGRTKGITMPSPIAQAALIRETYAKANLDLSKPCDRPQFFEAHGTGTPAGDPIEAEAISTAFFGDGKDGHQTLYVGSIKTIVGHTEGTAGLAAVIKASLALQHGIVPPNLLFENLNPAVAPFYENLHIPTKAQHWPDTHGGPRRVSVNSFGFGGANGHAILERYEPQETTLQKRLNHDTRIFTPFAFSATTERSLAANLAAYAAYLKANQNVNLRDLSWTLSSRRSALPSRIIFAASSVDGLVTQISDTLKAAKSNSGKLIDEHTARYSASANPKIIGIFTGQGAQWATMGKALVLGSEFARKLINRLEQRLARLPSGDRPSWSLLKELQAEGSISRVGEAAISQPLCTAIQVLLVELLRGAGIKFKAVVGHSSGEIAAAYAAGLIATPEDAIVIAYYRGFHSKLASGPAGQQGAMIAVGTSLEDAQELVSLPAFEGRITVAASNSLASVTLSGDEDAIQEALEILEEERKFVRRLRIDKAYHSHHMLRASDAYLASLRSSGIQPFSSPDPRCSWFSSVTVQEIRGSKHLSDTYWNDNMVNPVLFSQAVELAVTELGPFDVAIEVGPHPALQGPVKQTIEAISGDALAYTGTLQRGLNDIHALANSLGSLWKLFGESVVSFSDYDDLVSAYGSRKLLKNLPIYSWDHDRVFWHESRVSKAYRTRKEGINEILGTRSVDGAENQVQWHNVLRPKEIPWISGHRIQGQMVFPGAGYIAAALESIRAIEGTNEIKLIELEDIDIGQAIAFNEEESSVETLFSLTGIVRNKDSVSAAFSFHSHTGHDSQNLSLNCSGRLRYDLGDATTDALPPRSSERAFNLTDVPPDRFYSSLDDVGYQYSGKFKALSSLKRKLGAATGEICKASNNPSTELLVHPATLDAAIQSIILAFCWPGDGRLWSIHVPTNIRRVRVNPALWLKAPSAEEYLQFDATIDSNDQAVIDGDVDIFTSDGVHTMLQLEGMQAKPFSEATAANDFHLFSQMIWDRASPDGDAVAWDGRATTDHYELAYIFERVAYYYLRTLDQAISDDLRVNFQAHHKSLFTFVDYVLSTVASGKHQYIKKQWASDSHAEILALIESHPESIDLRIMHTVGEHLPAVVRGETTILEHMLQDNMLNDYYINALGFHEYTEYLARMVGQIAHSKPDLKILEIVGAGTGGATKSILRELGQTFANYVFTDISSGFFENAQIVFQSFASKIAFKTLNIENDPTLQNFEEGSFDLIIASLVLHATVDLEETLKNARRLLKPGGHLIMLEITNNGQARLGFVFGGLPGWWLGRDDGRILSPCITAPEWDALLRKTGFAGIETITPDLDPLPYPLSVIAAQAIDDRVTFLRQPLLSGKLDFEIPHLTLLGGVTSSSLQLLGEIIGLTSHFVGNIHRIDTLDTVAHFELPRQGSVISLIDLDEPIFKSISAVKLEAVKMVFEQSKSVLWVTRGARSDSPFSSMTIGFGRTLLLELPHLRLQFLDLGSPNKVDARGIVETFLRSEAVGAWQLGGRELDALWPLEPELALDNGLQLVPRLKLDPSRNARYNSAKRPISARVQTSKSVLTVSWQRSAYVIRALPEWISIGNVQDVYVDLDVTFSSIQAVSTPQGSHLFLIFGNNSLGESFVALSPNLQSKLRVPKNDLVPISPTLNELQVVGRLLHHILAARILVEVSNGGVIVVLDPNEYFGIVLSQLAAEIGVRVQFLTTSPASDKSSWSHVHPQAPHRTIKALLPQDLTLFVNFSEDSVFAGRIIDNLPPYSKVQSLETLLSKTSHLALQFPKKPAGAFLAKALENVLSELPASHAVDFGVLQMTDVGKKTSENLGLTILDWSRTQEIDVRIEPIDSTTLFSKEKTYWLVGLTGGLGQSLCTWMVQHGARYVVLSSRNPKVDDRWLEDLSALGATIRILANDITNKESVRLAYDEITATLPPLAGIAQGAMVLHDALFLDLDLEKVQKVLKPKVDGSIYLQEVIGDKVLDFFVFFSSVASVTGNGGQSHYAAANMFMVGLAAQRRKRGLAASVIHIGAIIGNGYITRELTQAQQNALRSYGNVWMSEQDFHQIFAEAVVCSSPGSGQSHEFMTGLRLIDANGDDRPTWIDNQRFSHFIIHQEGAAAGTSTTSAGAPVKVQLLGAIDQQQVVDILRSSFIAKLKAVLQMSPEEAEQRFANLDSGVDELGIDSLIAVEIRTWFIKELQVDMPVLKILGGTTVGELLSFALEKIPSDLIPNNGGNIDATAATAQLQKPPATQSKGSAKIAEFSTEHSSPNEQVVHERVKSPDQALPSVPPLQNNEVASTPSSENVSQRDIPSLERSEGSIGSWDALSDSDLNSSIESADNPVQRTLVMSFGQSRFWFLRQYLEDQTTFNISCSIRLKGKLNVSALEQAVKRVGARHGALRTAFYLDQNQQPKQGILSSPILQLEQRDIQNDSEIVSEFQRMKEHVFALERGELMRIRLLSLSEDSHQIIIGYHHINMDGISLEILLSDLQRAYDGDALKDRVLQYDDFTLRQLHDYEAGKFSSELSFWRKEFADLPPALPILPVSRKTSRERLTRYASHRIDFNIPEGLGKRIEATARKFKTTSFHFYLAVLRIFLFRQLDIDDLSIGIADGNRYDSDTLNSIGFYLNLLPLRFRRSEKQLFSDALKEAKNKSYAALANARVPFDILLSELNVPRSATYAPLFQVFLNYRQGVEENRPFCGCETDGLQFESGRTAYDITLDVVDNIGGAPLLAFNVQQSLYTERDGELLQRSFVNLLDNFSRNPAQEVARAPLYGQDEIQNALHLGRGKFSKCTSRHVANMTPGPTINFTWAPTLSHQVDRIASTHANRPAISDDLGNKWSYKQLSQRADAIAVALLDSGAIVGSTVGVFQDPTSDWAASFLAVLRIGAVYVPLDLRTPIGRLALIVRDSKPKVILAHQQTIPLVVGLQVESSTHVINISSLSLSTSRRINNYAKPESIAVHIFTSGTTGIPKGISLTNAGLVHQIEISTQIFNIGAETILQQTAYSFDMHIWQVFWALGNGGKLVIAPKDARGDSGAILDLIANEAISLVTATPSELISLHRIDTLNRLRTSKLRAVIAGGEQVKKILLETFHDINKTDLKLFNAYGPSEITIASHASELNYTIPSSETEERVIPVGKTFPAHSVYIVDRDSRPVPAGVPGEIILGGSGVSPGYLDNEALTTERFFRDNYTSPEHIKLGWIKAHRTGDRGRLLPDGALIVEGRIDGDTQIKLRGIRIDLQDIEETIIRSSSGVLQDVIVSVRNFGVGSEFLAAHVVFNDGSTSNREEFLNKLRTKLELPQSMIPAQIVPIDQLPVAPSGKVSRRSVGELPLPRSITKSAQLTEPEIRTKKIWEQVLPAGTGNQFSITTATDFFHVGGNSLMLVQLQKQIKDETGVEIPLASLFEHSTLGGMAGKIESLPGGAALEDPVVNWELETTLPLEFASLARGNSVISQSSNPVRVVILTGATGFLGQAILAELLEDRNVEKVYCIAVRSSQSRNSLLNKSWKVEVHSGDLSLPNLAIDEATIDRVFSEADTIIHNGADVSFLKTYQSLKVTNVEATKFLLKLSLQHRIPFHYVSSAGVGQLSGQETFQEHSMREYSPPVNGMAGYISSKWVSEQLLEKASKEYNLPVWIHRPSNITGEGAPDLDIMTNLLTFSRKIAIVPKLKAVQGYLNFVPVHDVALDLVQEVLSPGRVGTPPLVFLHHAGKADMPIAKMRRILEKETGRKIQSRSLHTWLAEAKAAGLNEMVAAYLDSLEAGSVPVFLPRIIKDGRK
ncbi:putative hybrid NRPS/PKS enzyme [Acephala macrosclerotiorum]|nr:putative hybrid NRPS/PKS enzyme [Acephala macrosclerotiorum]